MHQFLRSKSSTNQMNTRTFGKFLSESEENFSAEEKLDLRNSFVENLERSSVIISKNRLDKSIEYYLTSNAPRFSVDDYHRSFKKSEDQTKFSLREINAKYSVAHLHSLSNDKLEWLVKFTPTFAKTLGKHDKKIKGKAIEAISDLSIEPMKPKGNTIKALSKNKKGPSLYHIGDFRLI